MNLLKVVLGCVPTAKELKQHSEKLDAQLTHPERVPKTLVNSIPLGDRVLAGPKTLVQRKFFFEEELTEEETAPIRKKTRSKKSLDD